LADNQVEPLSLCWIRRIIAALKSPVPVILFARGVHGCWGALAATGARVIGVDWTETSQAASQNLFKPVDFLGCVLNYSTFMGLNLSKAVISKCLAKEVSFEETNLTQADCRFSDFTNSRFVRTNLTEADFTGAKNYAIADSFNTLKKTKFSLPEAMSLLDNLDICLTE